MPGQSVPINGAAVRNFRRLRLMSQAELADSAGVSRPYLNQIERGSKQKASPDVVRRLAGELEVEPDALLGRPCPRVGADQGAAA